MKNKILILTAWWPTKTKYFKEYSKGVSNLLDVEGVEEFFITTILSHSKYNSNARAIRQGVEWSLKNGFTHTLILDSDIIISQKDLLRMIESKKDVLLVGRRSGEGLCLFDLHNSSTGKIGWGCCLVKNDVFREVPITYTGDFMSPDRAWLKSVFLKDLNIWINFDIKPKILEKSETKPMLAFSV